MLWRSRLSVETILRRPFGAGRWLLNGPECGVPGSLWRPGQASVKVLVLAGVLLGNAATASANDSSAELGAGGVVLTKSDGVSMESEDLWISANKVRVSYVFANMTTADIQTRVAFPVPEWEEDYEGDIELDRPSKNPMRFKLTVDGQQRKFETEIKKALGRVKVTHHWIQVFPAGKPVSIVHEYVPVAGAFFSDTGNFSRGEFDRQMTKTYCVGPALLAQLKAKEQVLRTVHYILTTGGNWAGAIKSFKLTIAKSSPRDKVSVCLPDTRKVSPTSFVVERMNFRPTEDLKVLFIGAPG